MPPVVFSSLVGRDFPLIAIEIEYQKKTKNFFLLSKGNIFIRIIILLFEFRMRTLTNVVNGAVFTTALCTHDREII